jgi:hypothetical protein
MELEEPITDIANALVEIDSSGVPFRNYQPGVGPYGEPQQLAEVAHCSPASKDLRLGSDDRHRLIRTALGMRQSNKRRSVLQPNESTSDC